MKVKTRFKRILSGTVACAITASMLSVLPASAEEAVDRYPYTMFASSDKDGAISVSTVYSAGINGDIATNGTIATNGSFNFNGSKKEHAKEEMIYITKKLNHTYFNTDNVERFDSDYSFEDVNINVDNPWEVQGTLELTGNINLNNGIKAFNDININGDVKNSHDSVIFSETGDITIDTTNVNFTGLIYAPHGDITIDVDNLSLNNAVVIGETITIDCQNANINYGSAAAEIVGTESDFDAQIYAYGSYNKDNNSIDIEWYSNYGAESYEVWSSDDNESYTSVAVVSDATKYSYPITEDFEKRYFKVSMIDGYGDKIESVPFVVSKKDDGYAVDFLDSDGDGLADIYEEMIGTDKNNPDTDDDGLTDYQEVYITDTDPLKYDSVTEGVSDADADSDSDGLSNVKEIELGTNPQKADTDNDGLSDGDEVNNYGTDPLKPDTDDDGLDDGDEIKFSTDPENPDTDGNGVKDGDECFSQEINKDCFDEDLFDDNLAIPSLSDVVAKGNASKNAEISEYNGYLKGDERVYVGKVIEIKDTNIKSGKLSFTLDKSYNLNEYTLEGHTTNGLLICYNDGNTTTPLATNFDAENKTLSADISSDGIYFVLDVMSWLESLGLELPVDGSSYVTTEAPKKAAKARLKSNAAIADTVIAPRGQVDIVFIVDTTASMSGCINNVKNNLNAFVDDIKAAGITPNFALVEYKDIHDDGPNTTNTKPNNENHSNWFKNVEDFKNEIGNLSVSGGGDGPESAIDGLETARRLDMRSSAQKFFILVTDADYKIANNYEIKSMDEMINSLKKDKINVSVVSNTYYKNVYTSLYETTGGVFANVNVNFKDELLSISDKINEETNDGCWVFLKGLTLKHAKLDEKPTEGSKVDTDKDTLADCEELKSCEPTIDVNFSDFMRLMYGDIVGTSFNYPTAKAYDCYSDPTLKDTDEDGISDYDETYGVTYENIGDYRGKDLDHVTYNGDPLKKGLANDIVGRFTIVSNYPGFIVKGHAFLIYESYINDNLDVSGFARKFNYVDNNDGNKKNNWVEYTAQNYVISPNRAISIGNYASNADGNADSGGSLGSSSGDSFTADEGGAGGIHLNIELRLLYNSIDGTANGDSGRKYTPNSALSKDITSEQLDILLDYCNDIEHYNFFTNNCAEIAGKAWNKVFDKDINYRLGGSEPYMISIPMEIVSIIEHEIGIPAPMALNDSINDIEGNYSINFEEEKWTNFFNKEVVE